MTSFYRNVKNAIAKQEVLGSILESVKVLLGFSMEFQEFHSNSHEV